MADAGFNTNALLLTEEMVRNMGARRREQNLIWPTNQVSQWLLKRFVARTPDECLVMGLVYPATNKVDAAQLTALSKQLAQNHALLSGWELLGSATLKRVQSRMWQVVTPMVVLVLLSLWFAFRRATEIFLGLAVLGLSGVILLAVMALAGWSWNLMNLMALPLMLGTGVDYTIFIQLALRRHGGDLVAVRRSVGRALMLCGGTAVAGFGSLAVFQQSRHGQPRQSLRRGHRREHAHLDFSAAGVVAIFQSKAVKSKVPSDNFCDGRERKTCPRKTARLLSRRHVAVRSLAARECCRRVW